MVAVVTLLVAVAGFLGAVALSSQTSIAGEPVAAPAAATTGPAASSSAVAEATSIPDTTTTPPKPATTTTPPAPAPVAAGTPQAGRIKPGESHTGVATFYDSDGGGACSYDPGPDPLTAAMNVADYEGSKACGAYVQVRTGNGKTLTVRITNLCPAPCRVGQLDLSAAAFAQLAPPVQGEIPITWTLVSPPLPKNISIRYKTGSSQYWCGIQVIDHRNPVARLEVQAGGQWRELKRTDYNYFLSENGAGCGGAIAVTDVYGQRLVVNALPVKANVTQGTSVQFAGH